MSSAPASASRQSNGQSRVKARFVVTTTTNTKNGKLTRSEIWDTGMPLALGHPLKWVAEQTASGVRIRSVSSKAGEIVKDSTTDIAQEKLRIGSPEFEIKLPRSNGAVVRIRPVTEVLPAFGGSTGDKLSIFACSGNWVLSSASFPDSQGNYKATAQTTHIFTMREKNGTYSFDVHVDGVTIAVPGETTVRTIKSGEAAHVTARDISATVIRRAANSWRFGLAQAVELPVGTGKRDTDAETLYFRKALQYVAVGFAAFMVVTWMWPKPVPEAQQELVPAQFAKIVMTKPAEAPKVKAAASEGNPTMASNAASQAPEKVQKAAVVQAFRAKALNNAVSGLLKGGMTSLLAQSDFVAGHGATADARKMLDQRSGALANNGITGAASANTNQSVSAMGGSGQGKGAGYGNGEKAGVKGQGQAFVSMDVAGAAVDEGLTKDEVGEVIHRHLSEVRYCYESAMIRTPDLEGKLMVNFTIGGNGVVKSTEVKSSTLPDPRLDDCILRRLTTWKFPLPRGGIDVAVTYPFIFKTLGH